MDLGSIVERYIGFVQRWPRLVIFAILAITALFFFPLMKMKVDSSVRLFIPEFIQAPYDRLVSRIDIPVGFHEIYVLGKNNKSVLSLESLKEQARLVAFIRRNFDVETVSVVDILGKEIKERYNQSLENVRDDAALGEIVYEIYSSSPHDFETAAQSMISGDYDLTLLSKRHLLEEFLPFFGWLPIGSIHLPATEFITIDIAPKNRNMGEDERKQLSIAIRNSVDEQNFSHIQALHYSSYLIEKDIDGKMEGSTVFLAFLTVISMSALIYAGFRRVYYVLIPLVVTGIALVWAFGTAILLGLKITSLHTFVLALIVTLSIEGPVHIIKRYLEEREKNEPVRALRVTMSSIFLAMFLVSFTTIASFLVSYALPSSEALNSFEAVVLIGISYAFILECLLVPAFLSLKEYPAAVFDSGKTVKRIVLWVFDTSNKYLWVILALVSFAFLLSILNFNKIETNVGAGMFVPEGVPSKEAIRIGDRFATEYEPRYVLVEGNVTQPAILQALDRLQEDVQDNEGFERIHEEVRFESANTLLKEANVSGGANLTAVYDQLRKDPRIIDPVNRLSVSDKASKYILKNGSEYDTILAVVSVKSASSDDVRSTYDALMEDIGDSGLSSIPGIKIEVSGRALRAVQTELYVRQMQIVSSVLMFTFTFLFIFVTYRKLVLSIIISLPILIVSFIAVGLMPVLGMPLTWLNATVVALLIGLGVDYAIYIAERYLEESRNGKGPEEAARVALEHTGDGIWMASFTTITGFIIVSFSFLPMAQSFGILAAISIFMVFLVTILIVPPLLMRFVSDNRSINKARQQ